MGDFCVKKAIADYSHRMGFNVSGASYKAVNAIVEKVLEKAAKRAKANKRKTLMPHDF